MVLVAPKVVMIDFSEKNLIILQDEEKFIAECEYLSKKRVILSITQPLIRLQPSICGGKCSWTYLITHFKGYDKY